MADYPTGRHDSVYYESLGKILTVHIPLCMVMVGFWTLPKALVRRSRTKLIVSDQMVSYETGYVSITRNDIPLTRIDNINIERSGMDRMFGAGSLIVFAGGGVPTRFENLGEIERVQADIQGRIAAAHAQRPGA